MLKKESGLVYLFATKPWQSYTESKMIMGAKKYILLWKNKASVFLNAKYRRFLNEERIHHALAYKTPQEVYRENL